MDLNLFQIYLLFNAKVNKCSILRYSCYSYHILLLINFTYYSMSFVSIKN